MTRHELVTEFSEIIEQNPDGISFYKQLKTFLQTLPGSSQQTPGSQVPKLRHSLIKSIFLLGFLDQNRFTFWRLLFWSVRKKPGYTPLTVTYSLYGYHYRKAFKKANAAW